MTAQAVNPISLYKTLREFVKNTSQKLEGGYLFNLIHMQDLDTMHLQLLDTWFKRVVLRQVLDREDPFWCAHL
jgi:hypothetical protein